VVLFTAVIICLAALFLKPDARCTHRNRPIPNQGQPGTKRDIRGQRRISWDKTGQRGIKKDKKAEEGKLFEN
jgi:hypothetical protein